MNELERIINDAWENKDQINQNSEESIINAINHIIEDLDQGKVRVAEKINGKWILRKLAKDPILTLIKRGNGLFLPFSARFRQLPLSLILNHNQVHLTQIVV